MKQYKVGIERLSEIVFNDEVWTIGNTYWTTVMAETERQAKRLAMNNLCVRIAKTEWFIRNVKLWKHIFIDFSDLVIGE